MIWPQCDVNNLNNNYGCCCFQGSWISAQSLIYIYTCFCQDAMILKIWRKCWFQSLQMLFACYFWKITKDSCFWFENANSFDYVSFHSSRLHMFDLIWEYIITYVSYLHLNLSTEKFSSNMYVYIWICSVCICGLLFYLLCICPPFIIP